MRAGESTGAQTEVLAERVNQAGSSCLTVGARNVDRWIRKLWRSQEVGKERNPL